METINTAPEASSFVLLAEHQARTPASFYSGPPVLYYHSKRCKVVILERDLRASPALSALRGSESAGTEVNGSGGATAAHEGSNNAEKEEEGEGKEIVIDGVDVWVTSDKFLLYAPSTTKGVSIPYPSISLHAIQRLRLPDTPEVQGLYMQIATPPTAEVGQEEEEEEESSTTLTIVPPPTGPEMVNTSTTESTLVTTSERAIQEDLDLSDNNKPDETPTQMLYAAVSACSNLHPDPAIPGDEDGDGENRVRSALFQSGFAFPGAGDGGLPPPVDGSSGWITAENMHEFFDDEGNWIAGGEAPSLPLGPGAGTVRQREGEASGRVEENGDGSEETKWRRTD